MKQKSQNYRKQIDELRSIETLGSSELVAQMLFVGASVMLAWVLLGLWPLVIWYVFEYGLIVLEKTLHSNKHQKYSRSTYIKYLAVSFLIAAVASLLPMYLWALGEDLYRFAALIYMLGATLNTFLVRAKLWPVLLCYLVPNTWVMFFIAASIGSEQGFSPNGFIALTLATFISLYFLVAISLAIKVHLQRQQATVELENSQAALKASEEALIEGIEALPLGFASYGSDNKLILFNGLYRKLLPKSAHLIETGMAFEALVRLSADSSALQFGYDDPEDYVRDRIQDRLTGESSWTYKQSTGRWILIKERPTNSGGFIQTIEDVSVRYETKIEVERLAAHMHEAMIAAKIATWELDGEGRLFWSPEVLELFAVDPSEFDETVDSLRRRVHPNDWERVDQVFQQAWKVSDRYHDEYRIVTGDGREIDVRVTGTIVRDTTRRPIKLVGIIQDISNTLQLETKLRQAQKMEAIGQLTGGLAHDFNNLLAVVQGNSELLEDLGEEVIPFTKPILNATQRGADLTQRLLAFARQQPLNPEAIDLAVKVPDITELLKRTLGETIAIETGLPANIWQAHADLNQLENAILNLAINARDAMPGGGMLTIQCANWTREAINSLQTDDLAVGDYVVISVTDNGEGMSPEARERAFDPFFTTKEIGQGSGLGLSMVYGFAQQSGGQAVVHSKKGVGTTVKLMLPRAVSLASERVPSLTEDVPMGCSEKVLVVEDDPLVRNVTEVLLNRLGYTVVTANDGLSAIEAAERDPEIRLVLSDVVLPGGISGPELGAMILTSVPELRTVFMSGYPAEAANRNGLICSNTNLLHKPFSASTLAKFVKDALV